MSLKGKAAIVTGGNTGIGKGIVLALAEEGANVCIDYVAQREATEELERRVAALEQQDLLAGGREGVRERAAARAGPDDDDVVRLRHPRPLPSATVPRRWCRGHGAC